MFIAEWLVPHYSRLCTEQHAQKESFFSMPPQTTNIVSAAAILGVLSGRL